MSVVDHMVRFLRCMEMSGFAMAFRNEMAISIFTFLKFANHMP